MSQTTTKCCAQCFGDLYLEQQVFSDTSLSTGKCAYCEAEDQRLIEPPALADHLESIIGIYEESGDGELLVQRLREDWAMFESPGMDTAHAKELLADILNDGEIVRKSFAPLDSAKSDTMKRWGDLREELKHQNRFFPKSELNRERIRKLLPYLRLEVGIVATAWYRARIQPGDVPFSLDEMGPPPEHLATHGRANPVGIPYLYLASDRETAVSEVRPHTGELASVAEFNLVQKLEIVDLRWPRRTISPFLLASDEVPLNIGDIGFLEQLGEELTRPVRPQSAAFDYIPTQYLCEFIKACEFQGVMYRSSVGEGVNLALFEPDLAKTVGVTCAEVAQVRVTLADSNGDEGSQE